MERALAVAGGAVGIFVRRLFGREQGISSFGRVTKDYLKGLSAIAAHGGRDPRVLNAHLFSYVSQDLIESALAIQTMAESGALNVARREVRFLTEASVKVAWIQQKDYALNIGDKVVKFESEISSPKISIKQDLSFSLLSLDLADDFRTEIGKLYELTSRYVHLTNHQIRERITAVDAGRTLGLENSEDAKDAKRLIERGFATSIVLLLHSFPDYVAGDWLVGADGYTEPSCLLGSRYMAAVDRFFDYKAERARNLSDIVARRDARVRF